MRPDLRRSCGGDPELRTEAALSCAWTLATLISLRCDTVHRVLDLDAIIFQGGSDRPLQLQLRLLKGRGGVHQREFGNRQVALCRQRLETRPGSQLLLLLHDAEGLLRQVTGFAGGLDARAALLKRVLRVADLDADSLAKLLCAKFSLPRLQLGTILVGLRDAVANRDAERDADVIIRRGVVEGIAKG